MLKGIYRWINPTVEIRPFEKNKCQIFHNGTLDRVVKRDQITDQIKNKTTGDLWNLLRLGLAPLLAIPITLAISRSEPNIYTNIAEGIFAVVLF